MKWRTAISADRKDTHYFRGVPETECIKKHSFVEVVFLLLQGRLPRKSEAAMLDAILVAAAEHGVGVPSAFVPRAVISTGAGFEAAVAAGVLAVGKFHAGAVRAAMELLESGEKPKEIVTEFLKKGEKVPGFGHKIHKEKDPRTSALFEKARKLKIRQAGPRRILAIQKALSEGTGKKLPVNVDGAIAAMLFSLGFKSSFGNGIFILGRVLGIIAHVAEEAEREKPYRRLSADDLEYDGPPLTG